MLAFCEAKVNDESTKPRFKRKLKSYLERRYIRRMVFEKVTGPKSIGELWTAISNQIIKCQLSHTQIHQISDHKHDVYSYGNQST